MEYKYSCDKRGFASWGMPTSLFEFKALLSIPTTNTFQLTLFLVFSMATGSDQLTFSKITPRCDQVKKVTQGKFLFGRSAINCFSEIHR